MKPSEQYKQLTGKRFLYNIMPIANMSSVIKRGILCYERAVDLDHTSIALDSVQRRRDDIVFTGRLRLHQYANAYFDYNNPMLYKRKNEAEHICILAISTDVLDLDGVIVSDRNAASSTALFYLAKQGLNKLDYKKIFAQYWTNSYDAIERMNHKAVKCAEALVPWTIEYGFIVGAGVVSEASAQMLKGTGFTKDIYIRPEMFYR